MEQKQPDRGAGRAFHALRGLSAGVLYVWMKQTRSK